MEKLLLELSNENTLNDSNNAYLLWIYSFGIPDFVSNDWTFELLKNSGGFELITKSEVLDALWEYDKAIKLFKNQDDLMTNAMANPQQL